MASFSGRLSRPFIFVVIAIILLVILGSSAAPSYRLLYKDAPPKEIYNIMKDTVFDGADVAYFHHGRSSRWKRHIAPPANMTCDWPHCGPISELIAQPPPNTFQCPHFDLNGTNPLVVIGVFSSAKGGQAEFAKRNLWRLTSKNGIPFHLRHLVDIRFVLGRSSDEDQEKELDAEQEMYGDLFRIDGLAKGENMDDGKTYGYFRALYEETKNRPSERPVFAMKTDLDTFLILPNVLDDFYSFSLVCAMENAPAYWGSAWGSWEGPDVPAYFRGMGYAVSYPLMAWIASTTKPLPSVSIEGSEDVRTGAWFWWLPHNTELWLKNEHYDAQDYNSTVIKYTTKVSIVHALKNSKLWAEYGSRIRRVWDQASRRYLWNPQPWHLRIVEPSES